MKDPKKTFESYYRPSDEAFKDDPDAAELFRTLRNGERTYAKVYRQEDTNHDVSWVDSVYNLIPHLSNIVSNPRSFIKTVSYIVPAELAKRTGPESVAHLATHSQYVKEIDKDGNVIPSKILTSEGDIDVAIYENRFVMTLLRRLNLYVERRYAFLKHFAELQDQEIYYLDNKFHVGKDEISYRTEMKIARPTEMTEEMKNVIEASLEKIETARKYLRYFMTSNFMKVDLKGARAVTPPILMTNLLRNQPDYHACYEAWNFLNLDERKSMNFTVNEEVKYLNEEEQKRIDFIQYLVALDLYVGGEQPDMRLTKNEFVSHVLPSVDETLELNGRFTDFAFVRADSAYYDALIEKRKKLLEGKSEKVIEAAFKKEKEEKDELEIQKEAAEELRLRKEEEAKKEEAFLKEEEEKRRLEDEKRAKEEAEAYEKERLYELEKLRQKVKNQALSDKRKIKDENRPNITESPFISKEERDEEKKKDTVQKDVEALESEEERK